MTHTLAAALHALQVHQIELELQNEQLRRSEAALEESRAKYFDLYDLAPVGYCSISAKGRILQANLTLCTLLGVTRSALIGKPLERFIAREDQDRYFLLRTRTSGTASCELRLLRAQGTPLWAQLAATLLPAAAPGTGAQDPGTVEVLRLSFSDITERRQSEDAAHAANNAKSAFLANMSHEIRTPMNGVLGLVDVLMQTGLKPEQEHILDTIRRSSSALLHILNDILDFSKIEAGKLDIEIIAMHLCEVAESVAQLAFADTDSIDLCVFVSPALPRRILGDPKRLRQVLLNLLGNAVKFSSTRPDQAPHIALMVEPCLLAQGQPGVQLRVIDDGIGMDAQTLAALFQPFTQGDMSTARRFGGTGLGLSISQRLVALMGGSISVTSSLGQGSEFTVRLPLQAADPYQLPAPHHSAQLQGVQVLGISRSAAALQVVPAYCQAAGAQVRMVPDLTAARLALEQLGSSAPVVVLLGPDIAEPTVQLQLPGALSIVRMVARKGNAFAREQRLHANPMLQLELLQAVALASQHPLAAVLPGPAPHRLVSPPVSVPDTAQARVSGQLVLVVEDNATNRFVMDQQLRLLGYATEMAEDGSVALQMLQAGGYGLVLTDCHMPNLDGFELATAIRHSEAGGKRLPIIAVTGDAIAGVAQRCLDCGMDDYLAKPVQLVALAAMMEHWLPRADNPPDAQVAPPLQAAAPSGESSPWDVALLRKVAGSNLPLQERLLELFLRDAPGQVASLQQALTEGQLNLVADVAHVLKTAARMVGAQPLGRLCETLEAAALASDTAHCGRLSAALQDHWQSARQAIQSAATPMA